MPDEFFQSLPYLLVAVGAGLLGGLDWNVDSPFSASDLRATGR